MGKLKCGKDRDLFRFMVRENIKAKSTALKKLKEVSHAK